MFLLSGLGEAIPVSTTKIGFNTLQAGQNFSRRHFEIFFLFFLENKIWHFVHIVFMTCQILFTRRKIRKIYHQFVVCWMQTKAEMIFWRLYLCLMLSEYLFYLEPAISMLPLTMPWANSADCYEPVISMLPLTMPQQTDEFFFFLIS